MVGWGEGVENSRVGGGCTKQEGGGRVYKTVGWGEGGCTKRWGGGRGVQNRRVGPGGCVKQ